MLPLNVDFLPLPLLYFCHYLDSIIHFSGLSDSFSTVRVGFLLDLFHRIC